MSEGLSDGDLAARTLAGDESAFATLMQRHRDPVYRMVRANTGSGDEALDIVQEAFIAGYAALARYDRTRPFRLWISRIALNKCRDWARRRTVRRYFTFARPIDEAFQVADGAADPEAAADAREQLALLEKAIAALPKSLREPLILCAIEELSHAEAAELLGLTRKAVELRVRRARAELEEAMRVAATSAV